MAEPLSTDDIKSIAGIFCLAIAVAWGYYLLTKDAVRGAFIIESEREASTSILKVFSSDNDYSFIVPDTWTISSFAEPGSSVGDRAAGGSILTSSLSDVLHENIPPSSTSTPIVIKAYKTYADDAWRESLAAFEKGMIRTGNKEGIYFVLPGIQSPPALRKDIVVVPEGTYLYVIEMISSPDQVSEGQRALSDFLHSFQFAPQ